MSDLIRYAKRNLLNHMRGAGLSNADIEEMIANMPAHHELREHFVTQFVASLPEGDRDAASQRLNYDVSTKQGTIIVLTIVGNPTLIVPVDSNEELAVLVLNKFGLQPNGEPHNWYFDTL